MVRACGKITTGRHRDVKLPVLREQLQHMVKETYPRLNPSLAPTVQINADIYLGLRCASLYLGFPGPAQAALGTIYWNHIAFLIVGIPVTPNGCEAEYHSARQSLTIAQRLSTFPPDPHPVSYTHLRAHETDSYLVCRLLLEKKKKNIKTHNR